MSDGEIAYLALILVAFAAFAGTLYAASRGSARPPVAPAE